MNQIQKFAVTLTTVSFAFTLGAFGQTTTDSFGSGSDTFEIVFVEIGNPGNAADISGNPNPAGSVGYIYHIGKYEISRDMITKANNLDPNLNVPLYDLTNLGGNGPDRPATGMNWMSAAKFVNWLNTSEGYQAAYRFDVLGFQLWDSSDAWQLDGENLFRHKDAKYFLPSVHEWYKAAYFDPNSETYVAYPTGSNVPPTSVSSGTDAHTAVFGLSLSDGPADITQAGGLSLFGTMAQGGNAHEWEETELDLINDQASVRDRGIRGALWSDSVINLSSSRRFGNPSDNGGSGFGFRVATITVPQSVVAATYAFTRGIYASGTIEDLFESDNSDLSGRRNNSDIQSLVQLEIKSTSPAEIPVTLEFTMEGSVFARSTVNQIIELYDYDSGIWEQVDSREATRFIDSTTIVIPAGDLSRFVETGTLCIAARVRFQSINQRQAFSSNIDQAIWTIQ